MSKLPRQRIIQIIVLGIAAALIFVDQLAKSIVIATQQPYVSKPLIGDLVKIYLTYNDSAAFSIGFGITWVFTVLSAIAALALIWYSRKIISGSWAVLFGLALGGVVGNLIDRLTRAPGFGIGKVVDFIQVPFNFAIFNLADSAIVVVAIITVIRVLRGDKIGK